MQENMLLEQLVIELKKVIDKQNDLIHKMNNECIRLQNNLLDVNYKTSQYDAYEKFCNIILSKINLNPISSWWFLYNMKRKMSRYNKE